MLSDRLKQIAKPIWNGPYEGDPKPIIYLGGNNIPVLAFRKYPELLNTVRFQCFSYFYLAESPVQRVQLEMISKHGGIRAFLDSGAFSYQMRALKPGHAIDQKAASAIIDQYCDWVYACKFVFDFIVTFDYSRNATEAEWATKRIETRGLHPVPVFHLGSSLTALQRLIDQGYSLIGVGGMVPFRAAKARPFLDQVFNLTEKHGIRCHGFGIGGPVMLKYPWFSVDSTTWLQDTRSGKIAKPSRDPKRLYVAVPVSTKATAVRTNEIEDHYLARAAANLRFWSTLTDQARPATRKGLF